MAVSQRPAGFLFSLIGSTLIPIAERLLPSGSSSRGLPRDSSREYVQSPIWISDIGGGGILPLALCRIRIPPLRNQKTFCTRRPPIQSMWFPLAPASRMRLAGRPASAGRVSRPLGASDGATPFQSIELGRRRIPISPMVLPDPFLVPGGSPFIQTSVFHQSPLRS